MSTPHSQNPEVQMTFETLRAGLDRLTTEELQRLKAELDQRLQSPPASIEEEDDWLDIEYIVYAQKHGDPSISLESVREALAKIKGSMSDVIIEEREDRF
jgi:hypothetical protein